MKHCPLVTEGRDQHDAPFAAVAEKLRASHHSVQPTIRSSRHKHFPHAPTDPSLRPRAVRQQPDRPSAVECRSGLGPIGKAVHARQHPPSALQRVPELMNKVHLFRRDRSHVTRSLQHARSTGANSTLAVRKVGSPIE